MRPRKTPNGCRDRAERQRHFITVWFSDGELKRKIAGQGLRLRGEHRSHGLHSPYWWLRCAVGPAREDHKLVAKYKRLLEWDIIKAPRLTRTLDRVLSPTLGKSYVVYAEKPSEAAQ